MPPGYLPEQPKRMVLSRSAVYGISLDFCYFTSRRQDHWKIGAKRRGRQVLYKTFDHVAVLIQYFSYLTEYTPSEIPR